MKGLIRSYRFWYSQIKTKADLKVVDWPILRNLLIFGQCQLLPVLQLGSFTRQIEVISFKINLEQ